MLIGNGEYNIEINGINHWIKVEGKENNTIPLLIIHGGPGGNLYTFERTVGPQLEEVVSQFQRMLIHLMN